MMDLKTHLCGLKIYSTIEKPQTTLRLIFIAGFVNYTPRRVRMIRGRVTRARRLLVRDARE